MKRATSQLNPQLGALVALSGLVGMTHSRLGALLDTEPDAVALWHLLRDMATNRSRALDQGRLAIQDLRVGVGDSTLGHWHQSLSSVDLSRLSDIYCAADVAVISQSDNRYPARLLDDPAAPLVLFVAGEVELLHSVGAAIVGTRRCTTYGKSIAQSCASQLGDAQLTTWSGMAKGIDTVAHIAALKVDGATVAVLGGGLDHIYPSSNRSLSEQIVGRGALVSERPLGYSAHRWDFPLRNRLIAALADAVVVVESGESGGSLSTAHEAETRGIPVYAVPGPITSTQSFGTNALLDGRARPLLTPSDLVDGAIAHFVAMGGGGRSLEVVQSVLDRSLRPADQSVSDSPNDGDRELDLSASKVLAVLSEHPATVDTLVQRSGLGAGVVLGALSRLLDAGQAVGQSGWWSVVPSIKRARPKVNTL